MEKIMVQSCLFASLHPGLRVIATFKNPTNKGSLYGLCAYSRCLFLSPLLLLLETLVLFLASAMGRVSDCEDSV